MRGHDGLRYPMVASACLVALLLAGCGAEQPAGPEAPKPPDQQVQGLRLEARTDTVQTGTVGSLIASVPVVRVTLDGNPAPGREVVFIVSDGGTIGLQSQRTDTAGLASPGSWKLGTRAQLQRVTAHAAGAADLVFTAVAKAAQPDTVQIVAGNHQTAAAGAQLQNPLQVRLVDRYGNPVPQWSVGFNVVAGGGTVAPASVTSDSLGIATSGVWALGGVGPQAVNTAIGAKVVYFDAFACGDPCRGRDFLFVSGNTLYSLTNGARTALYTAEAGSTPASPAWSPDGRKIAFAVETYDTGDLSDASIYTMNADGSNVAARLGGATHPSWSPDGRRLAVTDLAKNGVYTLSAEEDGSPPVLLGERGWDPAWSPVAAKIAFITNVEGQGSVLRIVNADGSLVTAIPVAGAYLAWGPTWSPDGGQLAFTNCDLSCHTFTVSAAGSGLAQLTTATTWQPAWSPDGSRIAVTMPDGVAWLPLTGSYRGQPIPVIEGRSLAWKP